MTFGEKKTIDAKEVSKVLASIIYPNAKEQKDKKNYFETLEKLCDVFDNRITLHKETEGRKFTCYIEKKAYDAFFRFANDTYQNRRHEATGLIVGYYLHDRDNPNSLFIVGTHFLGATGESSSVTTEFSYQDSINHSNFCNENKLLPLIWIHSHPGFGVFYSGTDCTTLKTLFAATHQTGVVVDNLKNKVLGYKMYGNDMLEEDIFLLDLDKSDGSHLECKLLNDKISSKKKGEIEERTDDIKILETKTENFENERIILKKNEKTISNTIILAFSFLYVFLLVGGITLFASFNRTNDLEKRVFELVQQIDSISNSISVLQTIIREVDMSIHETTIEEIDSIFYKECHRTCKTDSVIQTIQSKTESELIELNEKCNENR